MLFSNIGILDENLDFKASMYVGIKNDKIAYIGDKKPDESYGEVYDGSGKLLMSGLVNSHAHSPMTLLRGYAENLPLNRWLNEKVFPFEDKMTGEDAFPATMLSIAEMLKYGCTSFSDMYFFHDDVLKAVKESGIKCNFSRAITSFDDVDINTIKSFNESEAAIKNYQNAENGKIKIDMSLHAEYTNRKSVIEQFAKKAMENKTNVHIHLSETEKEHNECKQKYKMTPTELFLECGVFERPTTAAHCVWVEDSDIEILSKKGVTVATCPASNLKLGSGVCDVNKMLKKNVNVAIGTDGAASNNSLNLFKDMYLCAVLPKGIYRNPSIVTPKEIIKMATVNGYKGQGRDDCGLIKEGNKADIIVLNIDTPEMYPQTDILNNIVYSLNGRDVVLTMVDGKILYRDSQFLTIDIEKIKYEVSNSAKRIIIELRG
ncbi:MAG: amidohydrolase [Oscillospiraceae bacterium]